MKTHRHHRHMNIFFALCTGDEKPKCPLLYRKTKPNATFYV